MYLVRAWSGQSRWGYHPFLPFPVPFSLPLSLSSFPSPLPPWTPIPALKSSYKGQWESCAFWGISRHTFLVLVFLTDRSVRVLSLNVRRSGLVYLYVLLKDASPHPPLYLPLCACISMCCNIFIASLNWYVARYVRKVLFLIVGWQWKLNVKLTITFIAALCSTVIWCCSVLCISARYVSALFSVY